MIFFRFFMAWVRMHYFKLMGYEVLAPKKIQAHRAAECEVCTHNQDGVCGICQCLIMSKTMLAGEKCPRGYWPAVYLPRKHK